MTYLVVSLGEGKGSWAHIAKLSESQNWDKIFLICDEAYYGKFATEKPHEYVKIDIKIPMKELAQDIYKKLNGKISDFEVAVNLVSGSGKEHMAIISALMKLGLGIRLVAFTMQGADEI